jgi:sucrose phosphorylase
MKGEKEIREHLAFIYDAVEADCLLPRLRSHLQIFQQQHPDLASYDTAAPRVTEQDAILITYGDMVQKEGQNHLQTLGKFLQKSVGAAISTVHILPFFPFSSDDGFSVIDYKKVNPALGEWDDVHDLGANFRLMFDAVINHISAKSDWFQAFLRGDAKYQDYFFEVPPDFDASNVFRPRALPLFSRFQSASGEKLVWTTFSEDQIDLNFRSPELLLDVIDVLLWYIANGAEFIRLDAIAFIWKESGTSCIHLPQTHRIIQLIRSIMNIVAPRVSLITETNVPHKENISYFGNGYNEAQMVYNFSLPPLTLHAFHTGNAETLSKWAATLSTPSEQTTYFNFLASHDGIGLMPARGLISDEEVSKMVERVQALGGFVSYKNNPDGSQTAYELNINYLDALNDPEKSNENTGQIAQRFLASQSVMLVLRGIPGIYFHSLFGSRNWQAGVQQTGRYRTINREKLALERLEAELADPTSVRNQVFNGYRHMLQVRKVNPAFHPRGGQQILSLDRSVFAVLRTSQDEETQTLCLTNVSDQDVALRITDDQCPLPEKEPIKDILTSSEYATTEHQLRLTLRPYQALWLKIR